MRIEYLHASKYGNGARVAEEFRDRARAAGATVEVHHIREVDPASLPSADLYVLSSPGRMGRPIRGMRRFLRGLRLPEGTRCALLTTEMAPAPDPKTGRLPSADEPVGHQRVRPILREALNGRGLVEVAEVAVFVTGTKGPLEDGWEMKVKQFVEDTLEPPGAEV